MKQQVITNPFEGILNRFNELESKIDELLTNQQKQQQQAYKQAQQDTPQVYSKAEVKAIFGISEPTLDKWCINGNLTKIKIEGSRRVYFSKSEVNKLQTIKNAK